MQGQVVVVTGAASGLGLATARRLVSEGYHVVMADLTDASAEAAELNEGPGRAIFVLTDIIDVKQVDALFARAREAFGPVEFLVNAAGVGTPRSVTVVEAEPDEFQRVLDINVKGTFFCCRAAIPQMREIGHGAIVNFGSALGLTGLPRTAMYGASKGAIIQLTRSLAVDHGLDNIRVNCLCPGPVDTPMLRRTFGRAADPVKREEEEKASTVLHRLGKPEEIAGVVRFLLSPDAGFMTGSIVVSDGGWTAK